MCIIDLLVKESRLHNGGNCLVTVCCAVRYGFLAERCAIIRGRRRFNAGLGPAILTTMFLICGKRKMGIMVRLRSIVIVCVLSPRYVLGFVSN